METKTVRPATVSSPWTRPSNVHAVARSSGLSSSAAVHASTTPATTVVATTPSEPRSSAAGGAAALLSEGVRTGGYGRACTCGPTALDQALPDLASQFVDQVIAPRSEGYVLEGLKEPQFVPLARQSNALFTIVGET